MAEQGKPKETEVTHPEVDFERSDINIRWLVWGLVILLLLTVVAMLVTGGLQSAFETRRAALDPTPLPLFDLRPTPPAPRLQPNPIDRTTAADDIESLQAREDALLNSYEWVDREAGVVRIPIERAIELLAEDSQEPAR